MLLGNTRWGWWMLRRGIAKFVRRTVVVLSTTVPGKSGLFCDTFGQKFAGSVAERLGFERETAHSYRQWRGSLAAKIAMA
jgi:hypothetical protein